MIVRGTDFGSILDPKIVPKSVPRGSRKVLEIMVVFACLREPPKIYCSANMAPTWTQLGSQDGPKLEPKLNKNRSENGLGSQVGPGTDFGTIWDRFLVDFGLIFGPILDDFGSLLMLL